MSSSLAALAGKALSPAEQAMILAKPAAEPPYGIVVNTHNPETLDAAIVTTMVLTMFFSTTALGIRLFVRKRLIGPLVFEDCKWEPAKREPPIWLY